MALLDVVHMTSEQRAERREQDEAAFTCVQAYCSDGWKRSVALTKAAAALKMQRQDVIAGYWRHFKRMRQR